MFLRAIAGVVTASAVIVFVGCGSREAAPEAGAPAESGDRQLATEEQLYEFWGQLCAMPPEQVDFDKAAAIAQTLAQTGLDKLNPLLERMGEEDASVSTYFLPLRILRPMLGEDHEATLIALTQEDQPSRARRTATELLSALGTDAAIARVTELMDAEDVDLAAAAVLARLHLGEESVVSRVQDLWDNDAVSAQAKQEIIRRIPETAAPQHRDIFVAALDNTDWDPTVRRRAISILGAASDETAKAALDKAAKSQPEAALQDHARVSALAIEERMKSGLGDIQFNVRPDGSTETRIELSSEPVDEPPAAE